MDIPHTRLASQRLIEPLAGPVAVVRWFTAAQAQDYNGAKWAIGQRSRGATEADAGRLFDEGHILRTHVLRPTWHFVLPADVRWLMSLTGPNVLRGMKGRHQALGIDPSQLDRAKVAFAEALARGRHLTRPELGQVLAEVGVAPDGQRLPHFLMAAELDAVIVSGPRRGKQFTYALFDERVPPAAPKGATEAAAELAQRYFDSHGPAQLRDFVWWSGLSMSAARRAVADADLTCLQVDGREYWLHAAAREPRFDGPLVHLLPNFDEYTVGYADRSAIEPTLSFDSRHFSYGNILSNVVTIDGRVRGAWRRSDSGGRLGLHLRGLERLSAGEMAAIEQACNQMSRFLGRRVELVLA